MRLFLVSHLTLSKGFVERFLVGWKRGLFGRFRVSGLGFGGICLGVNRSSLIKGF